MGLFQDLLQQYVDLINKRVWGNKEKELKSILEEQVSDLQNEQQLIRFKVESERSNAIQLLEKAKNIAEKANIRDFIIGAMQGNANVNSTDHAKWAIQNGYTWATRKGHSHII